MSLYDIAWNFQVGLKRLAYMTPRNDEERDLFDRCKFVMFNSIDSFRNSVCKYPPFLYKKILIRECVTDDYDLSGILDVIFSEYRNSCKSLHAQFMVKMHTHNIIRNKRHMQVHRSEYKMIYDNPTRERNNIHICGCKRCTNTSRRPKARKHNSINYLV
jgi:hypothetical protein